MPKSHSGQAVQVSEVVNTVDGEDYVLRAYEYSRSACKIPRSERPPAVDTDPVPAQDDGKLVAHVGKEASDTGRISALNEPQATDLRAFADVRQIYGTESRRNLRNDTVPWVSGC